ncbi:Pmr5/Cas1p GDSL/SGNH-like acyl-esterase family protein [Sesbania bispinosa]|nr:Pmr5/Cas1p GDSL/SGNH-like acyl-esterase family protein [Sesbania bispinosa]
MAGWHLSRNKVLFFSGALFITLAVGVHLTPYFPSVSDFITSASSSSSDVDVSTLVLARHAKFGKLNVEYTREEGEDD